MKNHLPGSINGIVTLNSPHQAHPFGAEGGFTGLYLRLNELWSSQSSWNGSSGLDEGAPDNVGVGDRGVLSGIVVVSITGGSRDHVVRADLTSMRGLAPKGRALHVWTTALPGVWVETDHDAIVWCGQLVAVLSRALANMHERIVEGGQHGGFRVIPDPLDRLQAFKESLFGRSQKHWHLPQMKPLPVPDALRRGVSMVEDAEKARAARARSTIIPRSDSYSFVGEKKKRPTDGASTTEGSICVPFSANRDRTKSMAVLTDMAPFRQVRISVCSSECPPSEARPHLTLIYVEVTDFSDGMASVHGFSHSSNMNDGSNRIMVLPHSRRRRHLHHSYDPLMHFGKNAPSSMEPVTAADLIDEGQYRHSGSIHVIVLSPEELSKHVKTLTRGLSPGRSVRIHLGRGDDIRSGARTQDRSLKN